MSKNKTGAQVPQQDKVTETAREIARVEPRVDDDFVSVGSDVEGWWRPEIGVPLTGRVIGRFERSDNGHGYFVLELCAPICAMSKNEKIDLDVGARIGVGERKSLEELVKYEDCVVRLTPHDKIRTKNGNIFWLIKTEVKKADKARAAVRERVVSRTAAAVGGASELTDDLPF